MLLKAHAKVNLFLLVTGVRGDFHTISSFVAFATDIYDELSIEESKDGNSVIFLNSSSIDKLDNTIVKALSYLSDYTDKFFTVKIKKNIPTAAGMGGGSADAAAILRYLGKLLNIDNEALYEIALKIGADVPVCLYGSACLVHGIGEKITQSNLEFSFPAVFINPSRKLLTSDVFSLYKKRNKCFSSDITNLDEYQLIELDNDLMEYAAELAPEIRLILNTLDESEGCISAKLCGSGPTCFGIFRDLDRAMLALDTIKSSNNNWLIQFSYIGNKI